VINLNFLNLKKLFLKKIVEFNAEIDKKKTYSAVVNCRYSLFTTVNCRSGIYLSVDPAAINRRWR